MVGWWVVAQRKRNLSCGWSRRKRRKKEELRGDELCGRRREIWCLLIRLFANKRDCQCQFLCGRERVHGTNWFAECITTCLHPAQHFTQSPPGEKGQCKHGQRPRINLRSSHQSLRQIYESFPPTGHIGARRD